jgi:hypothetical protein
MKKWYAVAVGAVVVGMSVCSFADHIWNFETSGSYQGWTDFNNRMTDSVSSGTLSYAINTQMDPQWRQTSGLSSLDAGENIAFKVVVRRITGVALAKTQFYVNEKLIGAVAMENNNDWQTLTFLYTGGTAARISLLRFDPASGQNGEWEIKSISAVQ